MRKPNNSQQIEKGLVQVQHSEGNHGTAFHIGDGYLITNCHCLPSIPDPTSFFDNDEIETAVTVKSLPSEQDGKAAIAYADPCGDIAVLQSLDAYDGPYYEDSQKYEELVDSLSRITINLEPLKRKPVPPQQCERVKVFVRTVDGDWVSGEVNIGMVLDVDLDDKEFRIPGGTSGSPVVNEDGICVGVLKIGSTSAAEYRALGVPDYLPVWLWHHIKNG